MSNSFHINFHFFPSVKKQNKKTIKQTKILIFLYSIMEKTGTFLLFNCLITLKYEW